MMRVFEPEKRVQTLKRKEERGWSRSKNTTRWNAGVFCAGGWFVRLLARRHNTYLATLITPTVCRDNYATFGEPLSTEKAVVNAVSEHET